MRRPTVRPDVQRQPRATYRVQLHAGFDFEAAASIADYLAALGISHLYCSPYLQAARGSTHGYDIVDPRAINRELGGARGHARLSEALHGAGLGQVLDIVPNHMAISADNPWWWDVLENGPASRYASYFDVDWDPPETRLRNVVLLPVLADHYGRVLERGDLRLARDGVAFTIRYHDHVFPVAPQSLDILLATAAERTGSKALAFIADALSELPSPTATDRASVERRDWHKSFLYEALGRLFTERSETAKAIDAVVAEVNASVDLLDSVLERQNFRLANCRGARPRLPTVLRHQRAGGAARRARARLSRHAPARAGVARGRHARRIAHRPSRRSARPGGVSGSAARRRTGGMDHRREDPRA